MKKAIVTVTLIVLSVFVLMPFSLYADVKTQGYPYDDYVKYSYTVENGGRYKLDDQGSTKIMTFDVTIRDAKTKARLSNDKLEVTLKNMPSEEYTITHKGTGQKNESGFQVFQSFSYLTGDLKEWDNFVKSQKASAGQTLRQGTFMGRKALFVDQENTQYDNAGNRALGAGGVVFVSYSDIPLPNGLLIGKFEWRASSVYFIGQQTILQKNIEAANTYFASNVEAAKNRFKEYEAVSVSVAKKATFADNRQIDVTVNTRASARAGETAVSVSAAIVIGLAGLAAAAAGAAGAGGSASSEEEPTSTFKMVLYKDFGAKIRIGEAPVFIQARMLEITAGGSEIERPDLTQRIEIFSPDKILTVGQAVLTGQAMRASVHIPKQAAYNRAAVSKTAGKPSAGTVSFRFTGKGGEFRNNVTFNIIGESQIKLADTTLAILATSAESFELSYELIDFIAEPKVELIYKSDLFELKLGKNKQGKDVILATPTAKAGEMNFQRFIHRYACEIVAINDQETIREKFELHLCYEGIGTAFKDHKNSETPEEIVLYTFNESEKDKRTEKAYRLPLAVMVWDPATQRLKADQALAEKLKLEFTASTSAKKMKISEAQKAVKDAEIKAILEAGPYPVNVDLEIKPAVYMIYPDQAVVAEAEDIDLLITINSEGGQFGDLTLKARLLPFHDFKAMIKWFIEYGQGTFVDKYLKIGDVATYHGALDFIENRVYTENTIPYTPKKGDNGKLDNHYEDGKYDVSRPPYVFLLKDSMPNQIGEFKKIQSLHHELLHTIEHQNGDTGGGDGDERHSYFIQHLTDVVKALADMERGSLDPDGAAKDAIQAYYNVFNDPHNYEPQTFSWFGVKFLTQHQMFERYANFDIYSDSSLPDAQKQEIAQTFKRRYFPGNLQGKANFGADFKETKGIFRNALWNIKCTVVFLGLISDITVKHPDYKFTERSAPQWVPGTLKIKATYDVEAVASGKRDTLEVELDGGNFDPGDHKYPKIDKFTVTWRATDKISDSILGQPLVTSEAVKA